MRGCAAGVACQCWCAPMRRCATAGMEWLYWYLLSPHCQLGVQLAVAILLTALPVFVSSISFPHACFSPVLVTICLVSMSPDGHLGTKLLAAYQIVGQAGLGALTAGVTLSIAKPLQGRSPPGAYVALLCVTTSGGLAVLTSARAGPAPITLWPNITIACLDYAVVVLWGQGRQPLWRVWRDDVGGMCLCGLVAAVAAGLVAWLVLPSLASEEVVRLTSGAVRGAGHSLSRYMSLLLDSSSPPPAAAGHVLARHPAAAFLPSLRRAQGTSSKAGNDQQPTPDQLHTGAAAATAAQPEGLRGSNSSSSSILVPLDSLWTSSSPSSSPVLVPLPLLPTSNEQQHQQHDAADQQQHLYHHLGQAALRHYERHHLPHAAVLDAPPGARLAVLGPSVNELRQMLLHAHTALARGVYEPPWLTAGLQPQPQRDVLAAAEQLINVVSTLQDVLVYAAPRLINPATQISSSLRSFAGAAGSVVGLTISSCAQLAEALRQPPSSPAVAAHRLASATSNWSVAKAQLAASRSEAVAHYWRGVTSNSSSGSSTKALPASTSEALAVMFVWTAVGGVMTAVERLDAAGLALLGGPAAAADTDIDTESMLTHSSLLFARAPSGIVRLHMAQQQQQQLQQQRGSIGFGRGLLPALASSSVGQHARNVLSEVLLLPVLHNIAGFWLSAARSLGAAAHRHCCRSRSSSSSSRPPASQGAATPPSWRQSLRRNRALAAALKLWAAMSGLVCLFIVVAENPRGSIHPTVAAAVLTVPTHGVIALVLAWH